MSEYDVIVIGAGPGGYVAAIKAAQNGKRVALVEKNRMGGTCLNVGCIPTKAMVKSAEVVDTMKHASEFGVDVKDFKVNYSKIVERRNGVVENLVASLTGLIRANKIDIFEGKARFRSQHEIAVEGDKSVWLKAKNILIATGSVVKTLKSIPTDGRRVLDSDTILNLEELPESLLIVGGGYIGCEFASIFNALGVKVTIVEFLPAIVQAQGKAISDYLTASFEKSGIEILTGTGVEGVNVRDQSVQVKLTTGESKTVSHVLCCPGRSPNTEGLDLNAAALKTNKHGFIEVNDVMQTEVPHIYAIGDVIGLSMLAHSASFMGVTAIEQMFHGEATPFSKLAVPAIIFTHPECASVGHTLESAKEKGIDCKSARYPFNALGKARAEGIEGFVEVVIDKETAEILGAQVVGPHASDLIAEITLAIQHEIPADCIAETIHAHPTMSEAILEVCELVLDHPTHYPPVKPQAKK